MIGGADTDCVAEGHGEGEGAGGGCAPSCAEREAKATSISQSEWEAKKRSINNLHLYCCVGLSMEKKFPLQVRGATAPPCPPPKYGPVIATNIFDL